MIKCPICNSKHHSEDALFSHLMTTHKKNYLVQTIIDLIHQLENILKIVDALEKRIDAIEKRMNK